MLEFQDDEDGDDLARPDGLNAVGVVGTRESEKRALRVGAGILIVAFLRDVEVGSVGEGGSRERDEKPEGAEDGRNGH